MKVHPTGSPEERALKNPVATKAGHQHSILLMIAAQVPLEEGLGNTAATHEDALLRPP